MDKNKKSKMDKYFIDKYGEQCTNLGHLYSFGYSTLPRLIRYSSAISPDAKICYEAMIDMIHNNDEPIPWTYYPSQKRIGFITGLSRKVVMNAMKELTDKELVGKKQQGLGLSNVYCLLKPSKDFVVEAIKKRLVLQRINDDIISWDDVDDYGNITNEDIIKEINELVSSFQDNDNLLTRITSKKSQNGTSVGLKQALQEGFSQNPPAAVLTLSEEPFPQKQELTSGELTSVGCIPIINDINNTVGPFADFSKKQKNHDIERKIKFSSFRKQLKGNKLQAFELVVDNLEKVIGKTLLEFVEQSPEAVRSAYEEMIQRDKKHFSYFTKVFFSHLSKKKGGKHETIDYENVDKDLYL